MCLIALALDAHPRYRLVLAANRDEFHDRPTAPASYWDDAPRVFGGRDLRQHGSWLALDTGGRWAAVTNVRRMVPANPEAPSRGGLVAEFVRGDTGAHDYAADLAVRAGRYAGFNLLVGDAQRVTYVTNQPGGYRSQVLSPGVHAVSNATLDTPWPKLVRLRRTLTQWCERADHSVLPLFEALADTAAATDAELPDTGVGLELERFLSPTFIRGGEYGTRASTIIAVTRDGVARFHERRFGSLGQEQGETVETLQLG